MVETRNLGQYAEIHRTRPYGASGIHKLKVIEPWFLDRKPKAALDYGAGKSRLIEEICSPGLLIRDRYDPAIPEIARVPRERYDIVTCTDVFEHLDANEIGSVLSDIARLSDNVIFCIDTRSAATVLPNGENAHATVQPPDWWLARVREVFPNAEMIRVRGSNAYIKTWKSKSLTHLVARARGELKRFRKRRHAYD